LRGVEPQFDWTQNNRMAALRRIQQNYLVQTLLVPAIWAAFGATIVALVAFSKGNVFALTGADFKAAVGAGGFAGLAYLAAIWQHGLGSASFHADGTDNEAVEDIVTIQKAADVVPGASRIASVITRQASITAAEIKAQS